jgi:hypothetical protein
MGCLLEEILEGGDFSHVDPTTIMVRQCGKGWAASLRRAEGGDMGRGGLPP